ncbi:MAG: hypothetical protein HKN35_15655 [Woeseia sp.]|nr:hypothetical protein [Woeseia sp.]
MTLFLCRDATGLSNIAIYNIAEVKRRAFAAERSHASQKTTGTAWSPAVHC